MKSISTSDALEALQCREDAHDHVDPRLHDAVKDASKLFLVTLKDEDAFLSLIWQEIDATRILTPGNRKNPSRRLRDIARYMASQQFTFADLAGGKARGEDIYDRSWFGPCVAIEKNFDYGRFGWVSITPATDGERLQSPKGSFYIYDGVHKSLVLAMLLRSGKRTYREVQALLILPRAS